MPVIPETLIFLIKQLQLKGEITPAEMSVETSMSRDSTDKKNRLSHESTGSPSTRNIRSLCIWTALCVHLLCTAQIYPYSVSAQICQNRQMSKQKKIQFHIEAYDQKVKGCFGGVKANGKQSGNGDDSDTIK